MIWVNMFMPAVAYGAWYIHLRFEIGKDTRVHEVSLLGLWTACFTFRPITAANFMRADSLNR